MAVQTVKVTLWGSPIGYLHQQENGLIGFQYDADFIFATVQTLNRDEHLLEFDKDHFDCIVLDEAHHVPPARHRREAGQGASGPSRVREGHDLAAPQRHEGEDRRGAARRVFLR